MSRLSMPMSCCAAAVWDRATMELVTYHGPEDGQLSLAQLGVFVVFLVGLVVTSCTCLRWGWGLGARWATRRGKSQAPTYFSQGVQT